MPLRILAAALVLAIATLAAAQQQMTMINPEPLDPSDPRAKSAAAIASLLGARDFDGAVKYLRENASVDSVAAKVPETEVEPFRTAIAAAAEVDRILPGRGDTEVIVLLAPAGGGRGGRLALIVEMDPAAPHRIRKISSLQTQTRRSTHAGPPPAEGGEAEDFVTRRAKELIAAINTDDVSARQAFLQSAWNFDASGHSAGGAMDELHGLRDRLGAGLKLSRLERTAEGDVVHVENKDGRKSTIRVVVEKKPPHRLYTR
jgi:hypothetical protein